MRIWFILSGIWLFAVNLPGQPALLRYDPVRADTCLGTAAAASVPVKASREVVIAVLGDTLHEDELGRLKEAKIRAKEGYLPE